MFFSTNSICTEIYITYIYIYLYLYLKYSKNWCLCKQNKLTIVDQYFADKTEADSERERALLDQWVCLTEERNAVMVPAPGSGIPGAPADGESAPNMERHTPVLFLDLNGECFECYCKIYIQEHTYEC